MATSRRTTILTVEDNEDVRCTLEKRLSRAGFDVVTASTGRDALECARRRAIDAMTLDVRLPDMDGLEVASILRSDPHTARIPIVVVTGVGIDRRFKEACKGTGVRFFIKKPYDLDLLVETLKHVSADGEAAEKHRDPKKGDVQTINQRI